MSTSAIKTIVEHNRLIDRTPLTTLRIAPKRSSMPAAETALAASPACQDGWHTPFRAQPAENSRARGGIMDFSIRTPAFFTAKARDCSRFYAMKPSPQPDRLEHLLSQARSGIGMENPMPRSPLQRKDLTSPPKRPRFHEIAPRAAPRTPSRKGMRSAAPKVPSIDEPP